MELFELFLTPQDAFGDIELPSKALRVPWDLDWRRDRLAFENDVTKTRDVDVADGGIECVRDSVQSKVES